MASNTALSINYLRGRSPVLLFFHIAKTGGSSVWRQLIASSRAQSRLPQGHQIFYDAYAAAVQRFLQKHGGYRNCDPRSLLRDGVAFLDEEYRTTLQELPHFLLPFAVGHEILVHLHSATQIVRRRSFVFGRGEYSLATAAMDEQAPMCVISLRDPLRRCLSHVAHLVGTLTEQSDRYRTVGWHGTVAQEPIHGDLLSYQAGELLLASPREEGSLREFWVRLPQLASFQMRQLIALWKADSFARLHDIMWKASDKWVSRQARWLARSAKKTRLGEVLGFTLLDRHGTLHLSSNAKRILDLCGIRHFELHEHFEGTRRSHLFGSALTSLEPEVEKCIGPEAAFIDDLMSEF